MIGRGLDTLVLPLSDADPCGPDLEAEDDDDYLNAIVTAETVLPPDYYVADFSGTRQPFDQDRHYKDLNLRALIDAATPFLERTRDLRLCVHLAKLSVLSKNLADTQICVEAVAVLLETQWDAVHPRGEDDRFALRHDVIQRLDDSLIIAALQNVTLFTSKRFGPVSWARYIAELRKTNQSEDTTTLDRVLADDEQTELSILTATREVLGPPRATLDAFRLALARIRATWIDRLGEGAPNLAALDQTVGRLLELVVRIFGLVEAAIVRIDPTAASEPLVATPGEAAPEADGAAPVARRAQARPALASVELATSALAAAVGFFERCEPSNPALLLLRQAQGLIGKSFLEAMTLLLPDHVARASVEMGLAKTFPLSLARLAEAAPAAADVLAPVPDGTIAAPATRDDAVILLDQVVGYFRAMEPSSPVPMLIERARALIGKDFMALLGDLLPADALKAPDPKAR